MLEQSEQSVMTSNLEIFSFYLMKFISEKNLYNINEKLSLYSTIRPSGVSIRFLTFRQLIEEYCTIIYEDTQELRNEKIKKSSKKFLVEEIDKYSKRLAEELIIISKIPEEMIEDMDLAMLNEDCKMINKLINAYPYLLVKSYSEIKKSIYSKSCT